MESWDTTAMASLGTDMDTFSSLIAAGMKQRNISLRGVAREIDLDPSFFSKVLAGKRTPPSDEKTLTRLAQLLGLDPLKLIISTGLIPSQIRPLLESEEFLNSVRGGKSLKVSAKASAAPAKSFAPGASAGSGSASSSYSSRKRPELSEDLL